jgi:DNA polymerase alpha subunit B
MEVSTEEFNSVFGSSSPDGLPPDVLRELRSIVSNHSMPVQELFYKWESYCLKMGEETVLNYDTVRALKQDIQESLERGSRAKTQLRGPEKKAQSATPRAFANNRAAFGM